MENLILSCIESRVESNRSFYGRFQLGPFHVGQGLTVANALRRTLLSELSGLAIVAVEIEGSTHEYASIKGVKESVLDLLLNIKKLVLTSGFQIQEPQIGYLNVQGPGIVTAADIKLPVSIQAVDPEQYIATLAQDGFLNIKFLISQGKNCLSSIPLLNFSEYSISSPDKNSAWLPIDATFMPVRKVNFLLENYTTNNVDYPLDKIILEVWTNGSIHPRQAIHDASKELILLFSAFQEARLLKSIFLNSKKIIQNKYDSEKKLFSLDIANLDLSLRPYTCLKRANINIIGDLLNYSRDELLLLKNFGKRSLEEVEISLSQIGMRLKDS